MSEKFEQIPLASIQRSTYNPRTHFDDDKLAELAASIKEKGVLEPVLLRPLEKGFEIVAGERRYRAAKLAELTEIPAIVRELDDQAAAEIAIIENAQRANLTPVEEARGFDTLIKQFKYTPEDAAAKMGLAPKTVQQRIRLLRLPDKALQAIERGTLSLAASDYLARMQNDGLREEATKLVLKGGRWGDGKTPLNAQETLNLIRREFMTELAGAPFPTADKSLVKTAGGCDDCPKRSGNQKDLFGEIKEKNVCLDVSCFNQKKEAHKKRVLAEAKDKGLKVLNRKEALAAFGYSTSTSLTYNAPYVDSRARFDRDTKPHGQKRTYEKLIGDKIEPVVAVDGEGNVRHLYPIAATQRALKEAGFTATSTKPVNTKSAAEKEREMKSKADSAGMLEALTLARVAAKQFIPKFSTPGQQRVWRTLAVGYISHIWDDTLKTFIKVFEIPNDKNHTGGHAEATRKWLANASDDDAYVACLIISLIRLDGYDHNGAKKKAMKAGFEELGIDLDELQANHLKALKEKAAEKAATSAKAAKPAKAAKKGAKRGRAKVTASAS